MKTIELTRNKKAIVDDEDYNFLVSSYSWFCNKQSGNNKFRAVSTVSFQGSKKTQYMHRIIMERVLGRSLLDNEAVDHIDGNPLNNVRLNLRVCSVKENTRYRAKTHLEKTSKYKGVCWQKNRMKWFAQIKVNSKTVNLGYFENEEDAAREYDSASNYYFKDFSLLNFPEEVSEYNKKEKHKKTSRYKGISLNKSDGRWFIQITLDGKRYCRTKNSEEEAKSELDYIIKKHKEEKK